MEQWRPGQWTVQSIAGAISRGETYLMQARGRTLATVSLQWTDPLMWPDASDDAGYIHRLAVARDEHGKDVGRILLTWTEWTISKQGRRRARLDCVCDNGQLRRYYEGAGYRHVDDRVVTDRAGRDFCGSRYEKELT